MAYPDLRRVGAGASLSSAGQWPDWSESVAVDRQDRFVESSELAVGASLGPRFVARLIDSFLVGVVVFYAIPVAGFTDGFVAGVFSVAIVMTYFTLMEA